MLWQLQLSKSQTKYQCKCINIIMFLHLDFISALAEFIVSVKYPSNAHVYRPENGKGNWLIYLSCSRV